MVAHMQKEEQILFPLIKQLYNQQKQGEIVTGNANGPIQVMMLEHDEAGQILKEISKLSSNYKLPEDACNTYIVCYSKLKEFEDDLHRHIHLENNILFPKTLAI
jgi:regulator of cell morphogenesis and NO signaling